MNRTCCCFDSIPPSSSFQQLDSVNNGCNFASERALYNNQTEWNSSFIDWLNPRRNGNIGRGWLRICMEIATGVAGERASVRMALEEPARLGLARCLLRLQLLVVGLLKGAPLLGREFERGAQARRPLLNHENVRVVSQ